MIKVSVIVPVYNGEKTIKSCVDSLLSQTIDGLEIIVINDGSIDGTSDILASYGNRITVYNQNRQGQGFARNLGIKKAGGQYVGFVDADDTVCEQMYEVMYNIAVKNNSQIVQCGIKDIYESGKSVCRADFCENIVIKNKSDYVYNYFYKLKHTNEVCNKIIQKSFLEGNKLCFGDTSLYFSEDFKLNMDMILYLERISFTDKPFYNYYIKDSGHCRSDEEGRINKISYLFKDFFENDMDDGTARAFKCVAALTILSYCALAADSSKQCVKNTLNSKEISDYILSSVKMKKSIKHTLLGLALIYSPMFIKLYLLKKYYIF